MGLANAQANVQRNKTSAAGPARVGISGMASYLPPFSVELEDWCGWADDSWPKVNAVVGSAFRVRAPNENAYTMAATAVLRLIQRYDIDPSRIGFLGLGTESSTDNSAGAVIVKGMVNQALKESGAPEISRACEVPEFKHACLGGVYALKSAARFERRADPGSGRGSDAGGSGAEAAGTQAQRERQRFSLPGRGFP